LTSRIASVSPNEIPIVAELRISHVAVATSYWITRIIRHCVGRPYQAQTDTTGVKIEIGGRIAQQACCQNRTIDATLHISAAYLASASQTAVSCAIVARAVIAGDCIEYPTPTGKAV
jgi:hypothetical protein